MELAEQQRLVENLSRLQFEMQNLDMQLSGKGPGRDFSSAFEAPKTPTESLQKLGEEFRRACDAVVQAERSSVAGASSFFPPLEQLAALIPEAVTTESPAAPASMPSKDPSAMSSPIAGKEAMPVAQPQPQSQPKAAPAAAPMTAQEKLQAALRATAKPAARAMPTVSEELVAARAMAKEAAAPQPHHVVSRRIDGVAPVVKKVAFPRLDSDV
jgi:hypothetical protein